jgi:hypothetical protein
MKDCLIAHWNGDLFAEDILGGLIEGCVKSAVRFSAGPRGLNFYNYEEEGRGGGGAGG